MLSVVVENNCLPDRTSYENTSDSEEAYLTKAEWLKILSDTECVETWNSETFESVLQDVTQGKFKIKRTPKCDLKLADYYYSLGVRIEEAYSLLEQCKKLNGNSTIC